MAGPLLTLRYMTRFACTGERCEDTCCAGLEVPVTQERLRRMRQVVRGSPEAEGLRRWLKPAEQGGAVIQAGPDGCCPFLDGQRLCSLQRRHGEEALADICVTFPRVASRVGERWEVVGTLACPEVARLCLLAEDAMDEVPAIQPLARPQRATRLPQEEGPRALRVRGLLLRLLGRREFPLASRLVFLARLAQTVEARQGQEGEALLAQVLARFEAPEVLEAVHRDFSALEVPAGGCLGLFAQLLRARARAGRGERFEALVQGVLHSWGAGEGPFDAQGAWETYTRRRAWLEAAHGARVHQYFHHASINHWMRHPVLEVAQLPVAVFGLVLRLALVRFVLLGHPAVAALCEGRGPEGEAARAVLDAAAVECFQQVARNVEAAPDFRELADGLAGEGGEALLGRTLVLARCY